MDHEDLLEKILDGLGSEYQYVIDAIIGRDTPISFDELLKKLINKKSHFNNNIHFSFRFLPQPILLLHTQGQAIMAIIIKGPFFQWGPLYLHKHQSLLSLAIEAVDHHHDPFLVVVSGVLFKGIQLCNSLFRSLIQISYRHQLLGLLHSGNHAPFFNHKLMQQLIP